LAITVSRVLVSGVDVINSVRRRTTKRENQRFRLINEIGLMDREWH